MTFLMTILLPFLAATLLALAAKALAEKKKLTRAKVPVLAKNPRDRRSTANFNQRR